MSSLSSAAWLAASFTSLAQGAPQQSEATPPVWFEEVAESSGLDFQYVSGASDRFRFPEIMGGGCAFFDYDGDGLLDIYLVQSGELEPAEGQTNPPNQLFRNKGDGTFENVTEAAGVGDTGYGMGVACGDYDGDGDVDLYVTNVGPNVLYRNDGKGKFSDQTEKLKVGDPRWGTSCAFFDADGDDDLDLYVVNNLVWSASVELDCFNYYGEPDYCSPNNYNAPCPDVFYKKGRLGYQDSTQLSGIGLSFGNGLGVAIGDFDGDNDPDVYVANDATPNLLWQNDGKAKFEDKGLVTGCAYNSNGTPEAGMGVQFVDIDMDGDLDLFMTHLRRETNTFYMNRNGRFRDATRMTGMANASAAFTGFGMGFQDFDLDGKLDLFVVNGAVQAWKADEGFSETDAYAEPNHLFRGLGGPKFEQVPGGGTGQELIGTSRGAAFGDYDNDGDVDILYVDRDERVKLLRNSAPRAGGWIGFHAVDKRGRLALGARVAIRIGDSWTYRNVDPAYSYLSSNDPRVHFGLGQGEGGSARSAVDEVVVRWADGEEQSFGALEGGSYHQLKRD